MKKFSPTTFYCFSPFVMILTAVIELGLLAHMLIRRRWSLNVLLASGMLLFLALFQIAEYGICEGLRLSDTTWARLGFASITLLPVVGTHLVYSIAGRKNWKLLAALYAVTFVWIAAFVFGSLMQAAICSGNYVIFDIKEPWEGYYYLFYNGIILLAMVQAIRFSRMAKNRHIKMALHWLFLGYVSFTVPAAVIWFITDGADTALPSIMCGFAVIMAVLLAAKTIPTAENKKR
jgi:hypothetical protein